MKWRYYIPLLIIFNIVFGVCIANAQWYVDCDGGNDSNNGTSWSLAKLTWASLEPSVTAYDTVYGVGDCTEAFTLASVAGVIYIDSTLSKIGVTSPTTKTDTLFVWYKETWEFNNSSSIIINTSGESLADSSEFYGIIFTSTNVTLLSLRGGNSHDLKFWLCKFNATTTSGSGIAPIQVEDINDIVFKYCLMLGNGTDNEDSWIRFYAKAKNPVVQHCTFYGKSDADAGLIEVVETTLSQWFSTAAIIKDNLFINTNVGAGLFSSELMSTIETGGLWSAGTYAVDMNYNWYWDASGDSDPEGFRYEPASLHSFSAWKDSLSDGVAAFDSDGDDNSTSGVDPVIGSTSSPSGYIYLKKISPLIGNASDGTDIGWYQTGILRRRGFRE